VGDRLASAVGCYAVRADTGLNFGESDDVAEDTRRWLEAVKRYRVILERVIRYEPNGPLASKARECLRQVPK
jgi:hypothetical protein